MADFLDSRQSIPEQATNRLEVKRGEVDITPISLDEVKRLVDAQYRQNFEPIYYTTTRGIDELLVGDRDYAKLPNLSGKRAIDILKTAPRGSTLMDVGCGSGTFIKEVLSDVNPQIKAYGFDSRTWEEQETLQHLILGNIDDLPQIDIDGVEKFDYITCASVLYHLPDYLGAIQKMADRLKNNGVLLTSTVPRVVSIDSRNGNVSYGKNEDDAQGQLLKPDDGQIGYYRNRNVFDIKGRIIPMAEIVQQLGDVNRGYKIRYSVTPAENNGARQYGGQISVVRKTEQPLDMSTLYYCHFPIDRDFEGISYILARNPREQKLLERDKYKSVQDRFEIQK